MEIIKCEICKLAILGLFTKPSNLDFERFSVGGYNTR